MAPATSVTGKHCRSQRSSPPASLNGADATGGARGIHRYGPGELAVWVDVWLAPAECNPHRASGRSVASCKRCTPLDPLMVAMKASSSAHPTPSRSAIRGLSSRSSRLAGFSLGSLAYSRGTSPLTRPDLQLCQQRGAHQLWWRISCWWPTEGGTSAVVAHQLLVPTRGGRINGGGQQRGAHQLLVAKRGGRISCGGQARGRISWCSGGKGRPTKGVTY